MRGNFSTWFRQDSGFKWTSGKCSEGKGRWLVGFSAPSSTFPGRQPLERVKFCSSLMILEKLAGKEVKRHQYSAL